MSLFRCFPLALALSAMMLTSIPSAKAQSSADYLRVVQAVRDAKKKTEADERDNSPLLAIVQGEAYAKALQEAASHNDDAALLELYQAKHSSQWPRTVAGTSLLSYAVINGDADVVQRLIARGAAVTALNAEGWTALHHAAMGGNAAIVKMLLGKGADPNAWTNRFMERPLMLACRFSGGGRGGVDCARLLLERGAKVNAPTMDGETALMFAASGGSVEVVKLLLSKKADPTLKDIKGGTARTRVDEFGRIDAEGKITYTQDSPTIPTYRLTLLDALIRHGKLNYGFYASEEVERQAKETALNDFLTISRLLREAEAQWQREAQQKHRKPKATPPKSKHP